MTEKSMDSVVGAMLPCFLTGVRLLSPEVCLIPSVNMHYAKTRNYIYELYWKQRATNTDGLTTVFVTGDMLLRLFFMIMFSQNIERGGFPETLGLRLLRSSSFYA